MPDPNGPSASDGGAVLRFRDVTKTYVSSHLGRTRTVRGVSELDFEVRRGEVFGLLGLNGSGKTTTFKLALGLLSPTQGEVSVLGLRPRDPRALAGLGFLPELPWFPGFMTPQEILRFYGGLSGLPDAEIPGRVARVIERVGLGAAAGRRIAEFSKGMVQRVGLAQAILHDPALVVLDEPVSGLDPLAIKDFRDLLVELNAKGKTILVSSHSISELEKLCHRVGILKDGRLARVLQAQDWSGGLEERFIETVRPAGGAA
ncbi:MAG: ABC transporter ATP-binding protein [Elusimicrobia bacterium]|nr:ABC transporter ATP-binding protein [Elusimicrobiota bacterium]